MKIVDQFSYLDTSERELLLIHFNLGQAKVSEWLIVENEYTIQGDKKGFTLMKLLNEDSRFEPFLEKIKVFEVSIKLDKYYDKSLVFDDQARKVEEQQREATRDYLLSKYDDSDLVLISDVDECVDFSDLKRRRLLTTKLASVKDYLKIPHTRFWYDYDNLWSEIRSIPAVSISFIRNSGLTLSHIRFFECGTGPERLWRRQVAFEFSSCFDKEAIYNKYNSIFHTGVTSQEIDDAIAQNRLVVSSARNETLTKDPKWWLKKVKLTAKNSPKYVRENLKTLKLHNISDNYLKERERTLNLLNSKMSISCRVKQHLRYIWHKVKKIRV